MTAVIQLPLLQGLIRKDPISYREEFQLQRHHCQSHLDLLQLRPTEENERLVELLDFISHTISCYPDEAQLFIQQLITILEESCSLLAPPVRLKIFQSLVLVRNKMPTYNSIELLKLSFRLLGTNDKIFRAYVTQFIFNDIKSITITKTNMNIFRAIQSFLHKFISEESSLIAQKSVLIINELYRKRIWVDEKTVNILASALFNPNPAVFMAAVHFFLGIDTKMLEDEDEEKQNVKKVRESMNFHEHSKKTRKRLREIEKQRQKIVKLQKEISEQKSSSSSSGKIVTKPLLPAIMMIQNPMQVAEMIYSKLKSSSSNAILNFDNKLLLMNFLSQMIGCHKLIVLPFYSYLQKYITAHQQHITNVLVYLIQSCHEFIPPMDLLPIIKNIAFHFITERSTEENITLGINTIREIFVRIPSLLLEEDMKDFVQDLALYSHKQKKCVVAAARSLINVIRAEYPSLLHKSNRGKESDLSKVPLAFGQERVLDSREILNFGDEENKEEEEDEEGGEGSEEEDEEDSENEGEEEEEGDWEEMEEEDEGEEESENNNDDEEEGEWESVDDDDDEEEEEEEGSGEEEEEEKGEMKAANRRVSKKSVSFDPSSSSTSSKKNQKKKPSQSIRGRLDVSRVLSDSDLALFQHLKKLRESGGSLKRSREEQDEGEGEDEEQGDSSGEEDDENDDEGGKRALPEFMVDPSSLLPAFRTSKTSKIERMKQILSGRSESKYEKEAHAGGLTNKEKLRKKNYMMVRKGKREVLQKYRRGSADARKAKATQKEVWGRDRRKKRRV